MRRSPNRPRRPERSLIGSNRPVHDLVLRNGRIVTPSGIIDGSLAVDGETIAEIGADVGDGRRIIDVGGKLIFPGMFDPHMHLGSGDERTYEDMSDCFAHD